MTTAAAWIAVGLLLALCACGQGTRPNFVFVTLDTTRADHLGLYGYFRDTSPALDAFGREAIVFGRSIVPMATTLPMHTSLFTSTQPLEHGVLANTTQGGSRFVPSARLRTFAQVAGAAGWRTAAFVSSAVLKRGSGIEAGFEHFDQPTPGERDAEATTRAALAWLESAPPGPFLLWVHYFDAHWPYAPPPAYATLFSSGPELEDAIAARGIPRTVLRPLANQSEETRVSINLYDGELRFQDDQLAQLLAALEARPDWGDTVVVIAGDHGEGLGQHGEAAHGGTWEEQLHAPLLMRIPGEAPRRVDTLVTTVDVIPILLGRLPGSPLAGLLPQASGRDALGSGARPLPVLSQDTGRERSAAEQRYALTTDRWKFFHVELRDGSVRHQLFDRRADPFERSDVSARHPEVTEPLADALQLTLDAQRRKGAALHDGGCPQPRPPTRRCSSSCARSATSSPDVAERAIFAVFVACLFASLFFFVHPWYDLTVDGSIYIVTARSLATGEGYRYLGEPFQVRPPGFPLLIVPFLGGLKQGFFALNFFIACFGAAGVLLLFWHAQPRLGFGLALLTAAAVWLNPNYQRLSTQVMSDIPGTTLLLLCLLLERWASARPSWPRDRARASRSVSRRMSG